MAVTRPDVLDFEPVKERRLVERAFGAIDVGKRYLVSCRIESE